MSEQLDAAMMQMLVDEMEVAEIYSPPRVSEMARRMGLKVGWSLDGTTMDHDGRAWDFKEVEMRNSVVHNLF